MKGKKDTKAKEHDNSDKEIKEIAQITTKADLKAFITEVHEKMLKEQAAPIFAMAAMQQILTLEKIYDLLDSQSKEMLQEIWVKLSQSGFHLRKPPLLFGESEA
jgi:chromosome segregation and condensation protein ScpB